MSRREGYQKKEDYENMKEKASVLCIKGKGGAGYCFGLWRQSGCWIRGRRTRAGCDRAGRDQPEFFSIKYKDDIFPLHETAKGEDNHHGHPADDGWGLLSIVLKTVAEFHANILTIHQSIPGSTGSHR